MKDTDKNFSNDSLDDDIFDDVSDIDDIDEEYYAEFGDDEFDDDYDDRLEKVLDELSELKSNMSSPAAKQSAAYSPTSGSSANEVALYNEIARLRDELSKTQNTQAIQSELSKLREEFSRNDRGDEATREEIRALKAQIRALKKGANPDDLDDIDEGGLGASSSDIRKLYTEITTALSSSEQKIIDSVDTINKRLDGEIKFAENEDVADVFQALKDLRSEISGKTKNVDESGETVMLGASSPDEVNLFLSEIVSLRDELQEYKDNVSVLIDKVSGSSPVLGAKEDDESLSGNDNVTIMLDELTSIRTEISNYTDELDALKSGIADIKNIVKAGVIDSSDGSSNLETAIVLSEINELKSKFESAHTPGEDITESIAAMREELHSLASAKNENAASELEQLREEIRSLSEQMSKKPDHIASISIADADLPSDVKDTLSIIFDEIHALREEPDYSVMNEILALREEFQALKDQMAKTTAAPVVAADAFDHAGAYAQTVEEIRSLRDQLFAISMAKIAGGKAEPEYENYNNILLDEIASLREELEQSNKLNGEKIAAIGVIGSADEKLVKSIEDLKGEIESLKDKQGENKDYVKLADTVDGLKDEIASLKDKQGEDKDYLKLADTVDGLKGEIAALKNATDNGGNEKLESEIEKISGNVKALSDEIEKLAGKETTVVIPEMQGLEDVNNHMASQREVNKTIISMLSDIIRAIELLRAQHPAQAAAIGNNEEIMKELDKLRDMIKELEKEPAPQPVPVPDNKDIEVAIAQLREELAAVSGLNDEKAAKEVVATEDEPKKEKKPAAKKTPAKKAEPKKAEPKKAEPEIKEEAAEEKKEEKKKAPAKKAPAKKKPAAKKKAPAKKKAAAPKTEKPAAPVKLADKQVLDEYVATLDKGESDDISKMLKDILNYSDNGEDL